MAKRKKRNAITLVSLLLALAALIGVYVWYSNRPAKDTGSSDDVTPTIDLATIDTAKLSSIHYVKDDADINLVLQDSIWVSKDEPGRPINQEYVKSILNAFNDINADRVISEAPENLADYGLADPSASVELTTSDGTTTSIKIGNVAGDSLGYYGLVGDDGKVYLLPIEMGTALQYNNTQMTAVTEGPTIAAENITSLNIDNRDGEDYELKYIDNYGLDNSGSSLYSWYILKPYGEGYSADASKVSEIAANYTTFKYISCVDYSGNDLSKYGLDNPAATIDIGYNEVTTEPLPTPETDPQTGEQVTEKSTATPKEYKVYVGNKDEEGNYYVRIDGSNSVYTISASTIDKMLTMDTFSLLNHYVLIPNIDTVDKVVVNVGGTDYTLIIKRTTEKDADGKDQTVATYYVNGKEAEEEAFKNLYTALVSAQYDAEIKEEVKTDGAEPVMSISFHIFGDNERTVSASFLPYNDSFDIVDKDGSEHFYADKRLINDIAAAVTGFTGFKAQ